MAPEVIRHYGGNMTSQIHQGLNERNHLTIESQFFMCLLFSCNKRKKNPYWYKMGLWYLTLLTNDYVKWWPDSHWSSQQLLCFTPEPYIQSQELILFHQRVKGVTFTANPLPYYHFWRCTKASSESQCMFYWGNSSLPGVRWPEQR